MTKKRTVHNKTGVPGKYLWATKMGAAVEWGEVAELQERIRGPQRWLTTICNGVWSWLVLAPES